MRYTVIIILIILIVSNLTFADCIDDQEYEFSMEKLLYFWQYGHSILAASPQKITKTVDGVTFTSDYDNGSLEDVSYADIDEFDCTIYAEPGALGTAKYWFRFKMTGVAGSTITLNIDHSRNPRPVISLDGITWRRLTAGEAPSLYQIVLTFGPSEDFAELALFFPFGVAEIYQQVSDIVNSTEHASTQTIGQSFQGRDMWMVTVTDTSIPDTDKHRVWVHSRVHAGEVTATHTVLGILEQVTEDSALGELLRTHCIFNIVPLMNMDGVFLGHTRWDSQGFDIERDWCAPVTLPEVLNIKAQVDNFMAGSNPIEVALNLHLTQGNYYDTFCLAAGEYLVQGESNKLGQALAKVRVEPNKLTNIVLAFEQTGSLRLTTVDANTREGLSIKGILLLRDTNGWITPRSFTTPMPVTVNSINAGVYAVALLSEYEGRVYICNFQNGISIEPDKVTLVTLRMRKAIEFTIDVLDAQHKPVSGFECSLYNSENSPLPIIEVNGSSITGISPIGDVRLVLRKDGKTTYDDYVQVTPPEGGRTFHTQIVVE